MDRRGARATGTAGSGLGLYVARNLMAGMGGHIQVDPGRDGPGSCFVLTLPAVPEARGTVPPAGLWRAVRLAS